MVDFLVGEREQRELLISVKLDDDPRRPRAELSAAGVEKDRTRQVGAVVETHHALPRRASKEILVTPYFWVALSARSDTKR